MKRVLTALILIPLTVWIALWAPVWAFDAVLVASGLMALYEFFRIAGMRHGHAEIPGALAGLALLFAPEPFVAVILISLAAMTLALFAADLRDSLPHAAALVLGVLYVFGAWRCAMALRGLNPHWLMIALLVSWAGDTTALYVGPWSRWRRWEISRDRSAICANRHSSAARASRTADRCCRATEVGSTGSIRASSPFRQCTRFSDSRRFDEYAHFQSASGDAGRGEFPRVD